MKASDDLLRTLIASLAEACAVDFFSYETVGLTTSLKRWAGLFLLTLGAGRWWAEADWVADVALPVAYN